MKTAEEKARELYPGASFEEDYDLDDDLLDCCPKCGRYYDEIGADLQYCKACGWDADVRVIGQHIPGTSAYLDKTDDAIFCSLEDDEVFFRNELSSEELEDENAFGLMARKGEYFIFLDE